MFDEAGRHYQAGRLTEAERLYRRILAADPRHADSLHMLGGIAYQLGHFDFAADLMTKAIQVDARPPSYHSNLGLALKKLGRLDEAAAGFRRAIALSPAYPDAHANLGNLRKDQGRLDEAVACYGRALDLDPNAPGVLNSLAMALQALRRLDEAAACYGRSLALNPRRPEAHTNLGTALWELGRLDEAIACYLRALDLKPDFPDAHANLGIALWGQGRLDEAVASFRRALDLRPDAAETHNNLGNLLKESGRLDEAVACFRQALALRPDYAGAFSNLLVTMPFMSGVDAATVLAEARGFGRRFAFPPLRSGPGPDPDPDRRLRVGYLTPALGRHVLAGNLGPVLRHHRRDRVSVHVYAHVPNPDEVTRQIMAAADSFVFVHDWSDDRVAARIAADGIDILVNPMGHWANNRLPVFARKPAPIQVSYLCQGATAGIAAMDYTIGDRWLNRDGAMQRFSTERVVELPSGFQVTAFEQEPPIAAPPSQAAGHVTFASFNNPEKISDASLALWARVLERAPTARLLIKGRWLDKPEIAQSFTGRMETHGIAPGRVDVLGLIAGPGYLSAYDRVDIVLDTTPFSGGRTTEEALWMGVPVVTLVGEAAYGRFSYDHLCRIGAAELAAEDAAGFVDLAAALAADPDRLDRYRRDLRPRIKSSPLVDTATHVAELEDAYRAMWQRHCARGGQE